MQSAKSLDEEILEYLPHLSGKQKQTVLTVVKTFVEDQEDWWDHISQEEQTAIEKALEEAEAGDFIPHDEVMKKYDKWRKK